MIDQKRHHGVFVFLMLFAAVALLGACGNSNKKSTSPAGAVSLNAATTVGINVCTTCHSVVTTDWLTSKHANAVDGISSAGSPTLGGNYTPDHAGSVMTRMATAPLSLRRVISAASRVRLSDAKPAMGREACMRTPAGLERYPFFPAPTLRRRSDRQQSRASSSCVRTVMSFLDSSGTTTNPNPAHLTTTPTGTRFFITDTHFATPGNWPAPHYTGSTNITGYAMNYSDDKVCTTCHNPHKPATQNREWAQSAHADKNPINLNSSHAAHWILQRRLGPL